jgi:hypothetical protein
MPHRRNLTHVKVSDFFGTDQLLKGSMEKRSQPFLLDSDLRPVENFRLLNFTNSTKAPATRY